MSIYSQIKEQVGTRDVAEHYGYKIRRNGMMRCPFHSDKTPSMKVDKNFKCFGCQEKGDVIRFASLLFELPPYEAALKLAADMGLDVTMKAAPKAKPGAAGRAKRKRHETEVFETAVKRIYSVYCDYFRLLNDWAVEYAPRAPDEEFHPLFVEAMHKRDYVEYLLDLLLYGSEEDKAQVMIEKGKEVTALEKRIREYQSENRERPSRSDGGIRAGDDRGGCGGTAGSDGQGAGEKQRDERGDHPVL